MTPAVRILLIIVSLMTLAYILRKIRQSRLQIEYAVFWIIFTAFLLVISIFPRIIIGLAHLLGFASPANLVYILIIFILMLKLFMTTLELSALEGKVKELVQKLAVTEKEHEDRKDNE